MDQEKALELGRAALALLRLLELEGGSAPGQLPKLLAPTLSTEGWILASVSEQGTTARLTETGRRVADGILRGKRTETGEGVSRPSEEPAAQPGPGAFTELTVCATASLLKALGAKPVPPSEEADPHHEWHATLRRIDGRLCVFMCHSPTLFCVPLLALRPLTPATLASGFVDGLRAGLNANDLEGVQKLLPVATPSLRLCKTRNRSIVGSMNDLAFLAEVAVERAHGLARLDLAKLSRGLNGTPMIKGLQGHRPQDAMETLLARLPG
ncbi:MAG: hypothetical protein AAF851_22180 [Myxococcota bacterium]